MSTNWKSQIESAAYDLTHMEINTIISSDVTAAKTPSRPRELLHKLAIKYDEKLNDLINEYELVSELSVNGTLASDVNIQMNGLIKESGFYSFQELIDRVNFIEKQVRKQAPTLDKLDEDVDSDLSMLNRIRRNSQEIMDILYQKDTFVYLDSKEFLGNRVCKKVGQCTDLPPAEAALIEPLLQQHKLVSMGDLSIGLEHSRDSKGQNTMDAKDLKLDLRQLTLLKKAFDIGTSKVVLQTIIGLDGDVTTRIAKSFADNQIPLVNDLHQDGIRLSVNYWNNLINAITKFGEFIIGKLSK
ncbi:hypothetical protein [Roseivirga pacifica]|uniref:hypothetical protein n=1 Tax=Roseivirga pacifica TaxID=1267423 RepID=UPI002094A8D9|nr:hypothetical protein [Roseivirga pacifica]MCO6357511.1 hypothetical protein [Roseivirga pacifica]MCO6367724.1 hypothetical protein [Roseivirga pacifica]MCO6369744.1 hypothetical protein [Roseivirga pacifica]MCO6373598.1 hypothetical protein [Roseivirga pacifica]MCO6377097.1 hypothetical protein [Roseivirga pacifica]